MAMGGLGMDDSDMRPVSMRPAKMPGRGMGRKMEDDDMEDGMRRDRERDMERRMRRGREMEGGMGRMRPAIGGGLPPVQNMGPGNMPPGKMPGAPGAALMQTAVQPPVSQNMLRSMAPDNMPGVVSTPPAALGKMPGKRSPGLSQNAAQLPPKQSMMRNMGPNNMAPVKMRNGGMARKGKTMAKGGLVKGCGCVSKGVKKPRMM